MTEFNYQTYLADPNAYEGSEIQCKAEIQRLHKIAAVHTQGIDPTYLFKDYRTAESGEYKALRDSVIDDVKVTLGEFTKFMSNVAKSLHPSTVELNFDDTQKAKLATYLEKSKFWNYVQSDLVIRQLDTPNDFLVVMPVREGKEIETKLWTVRAEDVIRFGPDYLHFNWFSEFTDRGEYLVSKTAAIRVGDLRKEEEDESRYFFEYEIPLTVNPFV